MQTQTALILISLTLGWASTCFAATTATTEPTDVVEKAAAQVEQLFRNDPSGYDAIFHPSFLSAISNAQLNVIFTSVHKQLGKCTGFEITQRLSPLGAKGNFIFEGYSVPSSISVDPGAKHL